MFPRIRMKKTQDNKDIYKIKQVTIKGYKSIDFDVPLVLEFGGVNILLGANGAGKSNIVSFFRMLGFMMSGSLQRFVEQQGTNQVFLHYGSKKTPLLSGELHLENSSCYDKYEFSLTHASPSRLIINSEKLEW